MSKRAWNLIFLVAAMSSCAAPHTAPARSNVAPPSPASEPVVIPFELTSDKPFVQVRINDSDPLWFIFDSGNVGGFCLDRARAEALGVKLVEGQEHHTGAGEGVVVKLATTTGVTVQVGQTRVENQTVAVLPLEHVAVCEGRAVDGLVGRSFISQYVVELDYRGRRIFLHDPKTFEYRGPGKILPIRFLEGLVTVQGSITPPDGEPIAGDFVIDTGARPVLVLTKPFAEKHRLRERLPKTWRGTIGGGAGGECKGYVGRLASMQLGPFQLARPVVSCSQDETGVLASPAFAGIVGGPVLRRCRVFFDYAGERMILEPYAQAPAPYEHDMSGLFLVGKGADFREITVMSVAEGSPAADVGMRRGDVILSVDGRPARSLTLDELRDLLKQPDQERRLELRRGDERLHVTLSLRRAI